MDEKSDESQVDEMLQGIEEDEMVRDELKMPSDLEGDYDDEELGEEGLFPEDNEGSFPEYDEELPKAKSKRNESSDEEGQLDAVFKQANAN
jgi:hypothetical protein